MTPLERIQEVLDEAVALARTIGVGAPARYIPELANVPLELTSAAVLTVEGRLCEAGDVQDHVFTFQSSAKLLTLIGLLEERGPDAVFAVVGPEPSGSSFASVARLETHGPSPANPLINAGAITLCGQLQGTVEERLHWIGSWAERLYGRRLPVDDKVLASERATGNRNRSIAYFLKSNGVLPGDVDDTLEVYFSLCSLSGNVVDAVRLPAILATGGLVPGTNERVISDQTAAAVVSLMATCGMYDESGAHLLATGLPAKSGISGVIVAIAPATAGIAVASPRVNAKGGSVRGHKILRHLAHTLTWHFALPRA
jgi:glutaminase